MTTFSIIWYFCLRFNALAIYNSRRLDLISVHQGLVFCISDSSWVGWSKLHLSYYISLLHCSCDSIHWNSFTKFMRIALNSLFGKRPRSHEFFLTCSCWFWSPAVISVAAFYLVECFENLYLRLYMIMNLYLYFWLTTCCNPSWEQAVACHESDPQTPARMIETDMLPFLIQYIKTDHESYLHTRLCMMSVNL